MTMTSFQAAPVALDVDDDRVPFAILRTQGTPLPRVIEGGRSGYSDDT
jgi:hypothetical protein